MNLLEHYIKEIHSVKPFYEEWVNNFDDDFIEADITINCYGVIERTSLVVSSKEWERYKKQGYYMG